MTIQECYDLIGADYDAVFTRMMKKEALVVKFAKKFLNDTSYQDMMKSIEEGNAEEAFRAAHTLKGVAMNLGFSNMYEPASRLTEIFRSGNLEGYETWLPKMGEEYDKTVNALQKVE